MIYKQNIGVLSKNQSILKSSNVTFSINESSINNGFLYNILRCNGYYLLAINIEDINTIKITPSTSCFDIEVNVNQEDVYRENGGVVINLNQIQSNELCIKIKINKNESLLVSYDGNRTGKKVILLK